MIDNEETRKGMVEFLIKCYDKNEDGKIDRSELAKFFTEGKEEGMWKG